MSCCDAIDEVNGPFRNVGSTFVVLCTLVSNRWSDPWIVEARSRRRLQTWRRSMGLLRINAATLIKCTLGELSKPVDCWQETNLVSVLAQLNLVAKVRLTDEPSRLQKSCFFSWNSRREKRITKSSNSRNANHWKRVLTNQRKSALAKRKPLKARTRETRTTEIAYTRINERAHSWNANHWKYANVTWGT